MAVNIEQVREALANDAIEGNWKKGTFDALVANASGWLREMADEIEALRAECKRKDDEFNDFEYYVRAYYGKHIWGGYQEYLKEEGKRWQN